MHEEEEELPWSVRVSRSKRNGRKWCRPADKDNLTAISGPTKLAGSIAENGKANILIARCPGSVNSVTEHPEWQEIRLAVDSGATETVIGVDELPGVVLVEGAGSPAEINLRKDDIANMGFALAADVPVILIGDIDRGGIIAQLVGTDAVLPAADRQQIIGFIVNKFR